MVITRSALAHVARNAADVSTGARNLGTLVGRFTSPRPGGDAQHTRRPGAHRRRTPWAAKPRTASSRPGAKERDYALASGEVARGNVRRRERAIPRVGPRENNGVRGRDIQW